MSGVVLLNLPAGTWDRARQGGTPGAAHNAHTSDAAPGYPSPPTFLYCRGHARRLKLAASPRELLATGQAPTPPHRLAKPPNPTQTPYGSVCQTAGNYRTYAVVDP